jgi:hypothetical protein
MSLQNLDRYTGPVGYPGQMRESGWTEQVVSRFIRKHAEKILVYQEPNGPTGE